jgi:hypothetical protein
MKKTGVREQLFLIFKSESDMMGDGQHYVL